MKQLIFISAIAALLSGCYETGLPQHYAGCESTSLPHALAAKCFNRSTHARTGAPIGASEGGSDGGSSDSSSQ